MKKSITDKYYNEIERILKNRIPNSGNNSKIYSLRFENIPANSIQRKFIKFKRDGFFLLQKINLAYKMQVGSTDTRRFYLRDTATGNFLFDNTTQLLSDGEYIFCEQFTPGRIDLNQPSGKGLISPFKFTHLFLPQNILEIGVSTGSGVGSTTFDFSLTGLTLRDRP